MKKVLTWLAKEATFIVLGVGAAWYIHDAGFARGYTKGARETADFIILLFSDRRAGERAPLPDAPAVFVRPRNGQDI